MQSKTWVFTVITSVTLLAFYFLAGSIGVEAPGFVAMALVIVGANCYQHFVANRNFSTNVMQGDN